MKREQTVSQIMLKEPKYEELWYRKQLLGDANNMKSYVGVGFNVEGYNIEDGTIDFDETYWSDWYRKWLKPGDDNHFYAYVVRKEDGKFLGETFYVFDDEEQSYNSEIILEESARKLGYADEIVDLLIMEAFDKGKETFYTTISRDYMNTSLYAKRNFKEIRPGRTYIKDGHEVETVLIGVDKEDYMNYMYGNSIRRSFEQAFKKLFK